MFSKFNQVFPAGLILIAASAMLFISCEKDQTEPHDTHDHDEEELITSLLLTFTNGPDTFTFAFRDPDGEGGNAPTQIDTITLPAGTVWNCAIQVLNESVSPTEDLTPEILAEADEHLFCFNANGTDVLIERTDSDGQFEVGLFGTWITGVPTTGTVTVTLKHQPGVKDGTCLPGDTDIEVAFTLVVF